MTDKELTQEHISEWHTECEGYDYRYHWVDTDDWWVEYRDKQSGEVIKKGSS